ncbi:hypothetical protein EAF00_012022 [Botryotinia globosa]|nr:hypothetical protein EAF00_012022 [Botryotinia globosa]
MIESPNSQQQQQRLPSQFDCVRRCVPHYFNLHLPTDASPSDIKAAYRYYSRIFHPDKYKNYYRKHPPPILHSPSKIPFAQNLLNAANSHLSFPLTSSLVPRSFTTIARISTERGLLQQQLDSQQSDLELALQLVQKAYAVLSDPWERRIYEGSCSRYFVGYNDFSLDLDSDSSVQGWEDSALIAWKARGRKPWFWEYTVRVGSKRSFGTTREYWDGKSAGAMETIVNGGHWVIDNWLDWSMRNIGLGFRDPVGNVEEKGWADWVWSMCEKARSETGGEWVAFREANSWDQTLEQCAGKVVWIWVPALDHGLGPKVSYEPISNGTGWKPIHLGKNANTETLSRWSDKRSNTDFDVLKREEVPVGEVFDGKTLDDLHWYFMFIIWILALCLLLFSSKALLRFGRKVMRIFKRAKARENLGTVREMEEETPGNQIFDSQSSDNQSSDNQSSDNQSSDSQLFDSSV